MLETVRTVTVATGPHGQEQNVEVPGAAALENLLAGADRDKGELVRGVDDERAPTSINYTSGTTGRPKGVGYTHRGAYLNAFGEILHSDHDAKLGRSGDTAHPDYVFRVLTRDLTSFQRLYDEQLAALPGVQRLSSTLVRKDVVTDRVLPV